MRIVVTRPQPDADRTAAALHERGHEVLVAPLMRIEPIEADLDGSLAGVVITSANALRALGDHPRYDALKRLPMFAVGQRSAEVAREAGFGDVISADGNARDLVRLIASRCAASASPLLYLAGQDRAADLPGELQASGIRVNIAVVYRMAAIPYPAALSKTLATTEVDAVLHFSARSAHNYLEGAKMAGLFAAALAPRHFCLSVQAAVPLVTAGAAKIVTASKPDEASLLLMLIEEARG